MEKAIAIDEWSPDALTTSMVDDVFFILQKCGGRALAIGSLQCLCAILGQLNNLLRDSLRSALEYKWKAGSHAPHIWDLPCESLLLLRKLPGAAGVAGDAHG